MIKSLSLKAKLILSFGTLLLTILIMSVVFIRDFNEINRRFSGYIEGPAKSKDLAADLFFAAQQRAISARNLVLIASPEEQASERVVVSEAHKKVGNLLADLKKQLAEQRKEGGKEQRLFAEIERVEFLYAPVAMDIVDLAVKGDRKAAIMKISTECQPLLKELMEAVDTFLKHETNSSAAEVAMVQSKYESKRNLLIFLCLISVVIASALAFLIIRSLRRSLGAEPTVLSAVAQRVASGDMRFVPEAEAATPGSVLSSLAQMQFSLGSLIGQVHRSSDVVSCSAKELSEAAERTRKGVNQQCLEVDQIATAIHEMAATIQEVARSSTEAANAASIADQQAQSGDSMAKQAIEQIKHLAGEVSQSAIAMRRLKQESEQIGGVLDVIRSVADQTNLLALNAAIEAARAGDAGRGFAVVADEVRNLAKRAQSATEEIEALITGLQHIAEEAASMMERCRSVTDETVTRVANTGSAVVTITEMIANIQEMVRQIATAGDQQSAVAEEISRNVTNVRDIAEQSAASSEKTAVSSMSLIKLGSDLQQKITCFQVDDDVTGKMG